MEFDGGPVFDRHVESDIAERLGGDVAVGVFAENDEDVLLESALTNLGWLDPGETWQFVVGYANTGPTAPDVPDDYEVALAT